MKLPKILQWALYLSVMLAFVACDGKGNGGIDVPPPPPSDTPPPTPTHDGPSASAYGGLLFLGGLGSMLLGCVYMLFRALKKKKRPKTDRFKG